MDLFATVGAEHEESPRVLRWIGILLGAVFTGTVMGIAVGMMLVSLTGNKAWAVATTILGSFDGVAITLASVYLFRGNRNRSERRITALTAASIFAALAIKAGRGFDPSVVGLVTVVNAAIGWTLVTIISKVADTGHPQSPPAADSTAAIERGFYIAFFGDSCTFYRRAWRLGLGVHGWVPIARFFSRLLEGLADRVVSSPSPAGHGLWKCPSHFSCMVFSFGIFFVVLLTVFDSPRFVARGCPVAIGPAQIGRPRLRHMRCFERPSSPCFRRFEIPV